MINRNVDLEGTHMQRRARVRQSISAKRQSANCVTKHYLSRGRDMKSKANDVLGARESQIIKARS